MSIFADPIDTWAARIESLYRWRELRRVLIREFLTR